MICNKDLKVPLLGTEEEVCDGGKPSELNSIDSSSDDDTSSVHDERVNNNDEDDEEACSTGCTMTCTLHSDRNDDDDDNDEIVRSCLFEHWILWFILPILLFLQFWLAFTVSDQQNADDQISQLDLGTVNYSIILFMMASYLYRRAIKAMELESVVLQLVPEICMDLVLGLVLFNYIMYGFLFMVFATCAMALYSALSSCRFFFSYYTAEENDSKSDPSIV